MTALHWAAMQGDADLVARAAASAGAQRPRDHPAGRLHAAPPGESVRFGAVIKALVTAGASAGTTTATGATPLMLAASAGQLEAVNALLDLHADANAIEKAHGQTA